MTSARIHKVVLLGHSSSGKTTLAEALLHASGVIPRKGRVEDGTTALDYEPEEARHHCSLSLSIATMPVDDHELVVFDTPGDPDFESEVHLALSSADLAVLVVAATEGLTPHGEVMWRAAAARGLPRLVFVNKLDHEHADYDSTLESLRERLGAGIAPLELPIGVGPSFVGVADLLADEAITYESGAPVRTAIPDSLAETEHRVREALVEGIVVGDDELTEAYLAGEVPSYEALEETLAAGLAAGAVFPVLCGSALSDVGVARLASFCCEIAPRHRVVARAGDLEVEVAPDPNAEPLARVVKTVVDPFLGHLSFLEVVSGTLVPDTVLLNVRTRSEERLHVLQRVVGKQLTPVDRAVAGEVIAVGKLGELRPGDTLAPRTHPVVLPLDEPPDSVVHLAIRPHARTDEDRLMGALHRLCEEDPALRVEQDPVTHQTVLSGLGDLHLQVALERLERRASVSIDKEPLAIAYRETPSVSADAEGRHKKQSGGHGQFGVVHLRLEPGERGSGLHFVDEVVGGAIPRQYLPAVRKGVERVMASGGTFGVPVVDVVVTCDDGKFHPVDSSEASFEQAGALAFTEALRRTEPVLLEPVALLEVTVPSVQLGEVLGDLHARRARVLGTEALEDGSQVVRAHASEAELTRYGAELRALTGGLGRARITPDHYDEVPLSVVERLGLGRALVGK